MSDQNNNNNVSKKCLKISNANGKKVPNFSVAKSLNLQLYLHVNNGSNSISYILYSNYKWTYRSVEFRAPLILSDFLTFVREREFKIYNVC